MKSFNELTGLITENSGIFEIPVGITVNYLDSIVKYSGNFCYELNSIEKLYKIIIQSPESPVDKLFGIAYTWYEQCQQGFHKISLIQY
ncbi:hypothetical protein MXB_2537, partial [Myxobolus squamalis]